jgi:hypothetical protein|uniref:Methyltransferase FkbM domain-containing protein n=1 Tax=Phaeodactylum tricornutum TaxID=2850 RepID=A0A8J9TJE9_PHATR
MKVSRSDSRSFSPRSGWFALPNRYSALFPWALFLIGCFIGHLHGNFIARSENSQIINESLRHDNRLCVTSHVHTDGGVDRIGDGWHSIDVFYGHTDLLKKTLPSNRTWFSQASQDELVASLFKGKRDGYFIDLAANDATDLSNTYALEQEYGWTGLCVEPNPMYWHNLSYRDCQIVGAVVGQARLEQVHFRFEAGDHGGIAGDGFDNGKRWQRYSELKYTVTLLEILERYNAPTQIDYLSLDVEGAESFIMMNFPLDKYQIKVITAERLRGPIREFLKGHGYVFVKKLTRWGESLWIHNSAKDELDLQLIQQFNFPI